MAGDADRAATPRPATTTASFAPAESWAITADDVPAGWEELAVAIRGRPGRRSGQVLLARALQDTTVEAPRGIHVAATTDGPSAGSNSVSPFAAVRGLGPGCVLLVVGGRFDRAAVQDLEQLLDRLRPWASQGLIVDLAALGAHHSRLGRVLGRARIRCLIDGAVMSVNRLPADADGEFSGFDLHTDDANAVSFDSGRR